MIIFEQARGEYDDDDNGRIKVFALNPVHIVCIEPSANGTWLYDSSGERRETSQVFDSVLNLLTSIFEGYADEKERLELAE